MICMVAKVRYIGYMEDPHITTADVTQQIKKLKERKSAGPDGKKTDLFKILGNDTHCINILTDSMNKIIRKENNIPASLFLLVTYLIIEKMYTCLSGINTHICKIVALFFAGDGMILM